MAGPFFWVPKNSVYIIDFGHSYQHLLTKEDKCSMWTHTYMYMYICMFIHIYLYIYACIYTHIGICLEKILEGYTKKLFTLVAGELR